MKETKQAKENMRMCGCEMSKNTLVFIIGLLLIVWCMFIHGLVSGLTIVHYVTVIPSSLIGFGIVLKKVKVLK